MFCPSCGLEESHPTQFCRSCGTDLSSVRFAVEKKQLVKEQTLSAKESIGLAVAQKISQAHSAKELAKITDGVLPEVEKFLESPAEKRLRRLRTGTLLSSVGLGAAIALTIASLAMAEGEMMFLAGLGLITFFIGIGFLINAWLFSIPKEEQANENLSEQLKEIEESANLNITTNELLMPPTAQTEFRSVTENTTRHLKREK